MSATWDWAGAKWWKFDFHTHTVASVDYGKGADSAPHRQISYRDWLLNYMRQGIDCVAITDHNSGAWIDPLKVALRELESEGHSDYRPLYLFPGVEISAYGNIHILAIFDTDKTTSDIDSLLGAVGYRASKGECDGCTERSAFEVIEEIAKSGGLAIPAHVDSIRGLFVNCTGTTLEQILDSKNVFAVEITDPAYTKPPQYTDKKRNWSEILGSDSHYPSGIPPQQFPGSHFTWVKMSKPSYEGLRLALIDGALSLKRSDQSPQDPNVYGQLAIEAINVNNAKYLGRENSFVCQLNPWLNTIIGGRGTGKSTLLEFLRIVFKREKEIPERLENELGKYRQVTDNRRSEGLLTETTVIIVNFRKDGDRFRIIWSKTDGQHAIEKMGVCGEWSVSEGDIAQRFPIRIYSQKQIFELAKDPQALLKVVDDAPEVNYREWQLEQNELESKYLSICAQEREIQVGLQEELAVKGQLEDIKRKLEVFEKVGHTDILKTYQHRQNQNKAINSWEDSWKNIAEQVRDVSKSILLSELDFQHFNVEDTHDKELFVAVANLRAVFETFQKEINTIAQRIDEAKNAWAQTRCGLEISKEIAAAEQRYGDLKNQLSTAAAGDPLGYDDLVKSRQNLEVKLNQFNEKRKTLDRYRNDAKTCLNNICEHRAKITKQRTHFLNNTLQNNPHVQIEVVPFGNKTTTEEEFRSLIDRNDRSFERDIGAIDGTEGLLSILTQNPDKIVEEKLIELKTSLLAIRNNDPKVVAELKDQRFATHIQKLDPEKIDRIRCWFPTDSLSVKYRLHNGKGFNPIVHGSPGQKTAALLAFILSYGNEPLMLDQPEDDLDNHLIYSLIVRQLREIKQKRQVLVITHNANIVVNGDAENVIALDVKSGQTKIEAQGGLQESSVRNVICNIMEGGKEAFEQRYKRINACE